ncbi:MAG: hypothetical protein M3Z66_20055 [Chloroflexota bacterium]|nr:hypothetical protein [Chloroflexota bacterium]
MALRVFRVDRDFTDWPILDGPGVARMVVGPESGARFRSMHYLALSPGTATRSLCHEEAESVYYIAAGVGEIKDIASLESAPLHPGSMILVPPTVEYVLHAGGSEDMIVVGGPCNG